LTDLCEMLAEVSARLVSASSALHQAARLVQILEEERQAAVRDVVRLRAQVLAMQGERDE
jgi:hypothetical protein